MLNGKLLATTAMLLFLVGFTGCIGNEALRSEDSRAPLREQWGVEVVAVRLTAADKMVLFRYKVIDSEKAVAFVDRMRKAYMVDESTGTRLTVPRTRIGPLRQTAIKPLEGRHYSILFGNPGIVKSGKKVTVTIGDISVEHLVVE